MGDNSGDRQSRQRSGLNVYCELKVPVALMAAMGGKLTLADGNLLGEKH